MLYEVSHTITPNKHGKLWVEKILDNCKIAKSYYDKHHSDIAGADASKINKEFRDRIAKAIRYAREMSAYD